MRPERKTLSEIEGKVAEFTTEISSQHRVLVKIMIILCLKVREM